MEWMLLLLRTSPDFYFAIIRSVYAEKEKKKVLWMTIFRLWTRPIDSCRERTQQTAVKFLKKENNQPIVGKI